MAYLETVCLKLMSLQPLAIALSRISIAIILIWIGGLKFFDYEAEGIVPFVANSPLMSYFYTNHESYKGNILPEGKAEAENRKWHEKNRTYTFSYGLGALLITMGALLLLNIINPLFGLFGSILVIIMSLGTLSFLITTPETWVPDMGSAEHGFPYLSARGRLVIKDLIMMMTAFITLTDSARTFVYQRRKASSF